MRRIDPNKWKNECQQNGQNNQPRAAVENTPLKLDYDNSLTNNFSNSNRGIIDNQYLKRLSIIIDLN